MNTATTIHPLLINSRHNIMSSTEKMFSKNQCYLEIPSDCVPVEHFFSDLEDVVIAHYENLPCTHS